MSHVCDSCGYDNSQVRKSERIDIYTCESCDSSLCGDCLKELAEAAGLEVGDGPALFKCTATDLTMCAGCFEKE